MTCERGCDERLTPRRHKVLDAFQDLGWKLARSALECGPPTDGLPLLRVELA
jgi:hypothetical protein